MTAGRTKLSAEEDDLEVERRARSQAGKFEVCFHRLNSLPS